MDDNFRDAVRLAGTGKIRAVLKRMIAPDWRGNVFIMHFCNLWDVRPTYLVIKTTHVSTVKQRRQMVVVICFSNLVERFSSHEKWR